MYVPHVLPVCLALLSLCVHGQQWGVVAPDCGSAHCNTTIDLAITLSKDWQSYSATIYGVTTPSATVRLDQPVTVSLLRQASVARVRAVFARDLYNAYERFDFNPICEAAYFVGGCFSDMNSRPPPAWQEAERYVMCCDSHSRRGWGQHCLRWNTSVHYLGYSLTDPEVEQRISVTVTRGSSPVFAANLTSLRTPIVTSQRGSVRLSSIFSAPHFSLKNNLVVNLLLVNLTHGSNYLDIANWVLAPYESVHRISMDAFQWKAEASCGQPLHYTTATHSNQDYITDQFYPFNTHSLLNYAKENLLNTTDANLHNYSVIAPLPDDLRTSFTIELQPYQNPDVSELYLTLDDISVSN
eukprot:TRINITY_DN31575_c0_g1_i1.p1 TRINITY_DN31575_c0_g1~~TRINITY_DN31575_c0_g1_i1.p1  ORF type:complete len:354 (+),score=38.26 TRINITY_DN31575_c0_g1_i1:22-1083(+)